MIIGLYGRIGSGKTKMANRIADFADYKIIDLDEIAKEQLTKNDKLIDDLRNSPIATKAIDGKNINKKEMTKLVFNRFKTSDEISAIVWPYVIEELKKQLKGKKNVVVEGACLPAMNPVKIDEYIYIKRNLGPIRLFKIAKLKKKHWWQILSMVYIQHKHNRKYIKSSLVFHNYY